jgi:hypothetical protein
VHSFLLILVQVEVQQRYGGQMLYNNPHHFYYFETSPFLAATFAANAAASLKLES